MVMKTEANSRSKSQFVFRAIEIFSVFVREINQCLIFSQLTGIVVVSLLLKLG